MKITTSFWRDKIDEFSELYFFENKSKTVIFKADMSDRHATKQFFLDAARFVKSKKCALSAPEDACYQFAVPNNVLGMEHDGKIIPIKWFDVVINDKLSISHDIAFSTTLISRNGMSIPFGKFFPKKRVALDREFKIKSRAYKFIANQIGKA